MRNALAGVNVPAAAIPAGASAVRAWIRPLERRLRLVFEGRQDVENGIGNQIGSEETVRYETQGHFVSPCVRSLCRLRAAAITAS